MPPLVSKTDGISHLYPVAPSALRGIHRHIRTGDQRFGAITRYEVGNTDTHRRVNWPDRCGQLSIRQRNAQAGSQGFCLLYFDRRHANSKFLTANPPQHINAPNILG